MEKQLFEDQFWTFYRKLQQSTPDGFKLYHSAVFQEDGPHPADFTIYECGFAARMLKKFVPGQKLLDIGSYTQFVVGLSAYYDTVSLDMRARKSFGNEKVQVADAISLPFESKSFDVLVSLCSIEHFGLGRYGDSFDAQGDLTGFNEMWRVLKPGGLLIFTTAMGLNTVILFNAHRIYTYSDLLKRFSDGFEVLTEEFFDITMNEFNTLEQVTKNAKSWSDIDVYCGCWRKRNK